MAYVGRSYGVFATTPIRKGTVISQYCGQLVTSDGRRLNFYQAAYLLLINHQQQIPCLQERIGHVWTSQLMLMQLPLVMSHVTSTTTGTQVHAFSSSSSSTSHGVIDPFHVQVTLSPTSCWNLILQNKKPGYLPPKASRKVGSEQKSHKRTHLPISSSFRRRTAD